MDVGALTRDNRDKAGAGGQTVGGRVRRYVGGCEAGWLGVERVEFAELGSGEMVKLILQADAARRQLDGYLTALLGRFGDLEGQDAAEELCRQFGLGRHRARQQAKTANVLNALPDTLEASKQGWISINHARVMGESHQRAPMAPEQEIELITLAIKEDLDQFKKTAARLEDQRQADGGLSRAEQQQQRRAGKVFDGDNDMVVLHAELDRIAGERVKTSLFALTDRMFREDAKASSDRTHEQRTADALVALITQQPGRAETAGDDGKALANSAGSNGAGDAESQDDEPAANAPGDDGHELGCGPVPQPTTLIVSVDYDALTGQLKNAGLIDGTPIDIDELRHIACDASVLPAIFAADGQPLYMGRKQRAATAAQKLALYARDKHCIGCGMHPPACEAHHITWWDNDGPTDITNLVLLCPKCHKKVHKHGYVVTSDPTGQHHLRPPPQRRPHSADEAACRPANRTRHQPSPKVALSPDRETAHVSR